MAKPLRYFGAPGDPVKIGDEVVPCITTYRELNQIMRVFADPTSSSERVGLIGPPGRGKSQAYKRMLGPEFQGGVRQYHLLAANRSACRSFEQIRDEPNKKLPAVCDDCDRMSTARDYIALVRQMAEHEHIRQLDWETKGVKEEDGRHTEFCGKVLVVMNEVPMFNMGIMAILNRLTLYNFNPPKDEILDFADANMPDVPKKYIHLLRGIDCLPHLRLFRRMADWEAIGGDAYVRKQVNQVCGVPQDVSIIANLLSETPIHERLEVFAKLTGRKPDAARKALKKHMSAAEQQIAARNGSGVEVE